MTRRTVTALDKSFPVDCAGREIDRLDAPLSSFATPLLALDGAAVEHNAATMAAWTAERGLELMPHGKTTMAPALWRRQLEHGATGITVATGWQADIALRAGVPTVQLANACTDPALLNRLADWLVDHPEQEIALWADSIETIDLLEAVAPTASLGVLTELGAPGGRTGARTRREALDVAERVAGSRNLRLLGVAGYEGALAHDRSGPGLAAVSAYLDSLVELLDDVMPLVQGPAWITAGGSAYFDLVAEALARAGDARKILRSGAYLTHDDGFYADISPLSANAAGNDCERLRSALRGYARVISLPEPGLALLDGGKRDFPFDEGLPVPLAIAPTLGDDERPLHGEVTAMNDQHTFLRWDGDDRLNIGDVVRLGLSHPCTAFDKWRLVPVLDVRRGVVTEAVETFF